MVDVKFEEGGHVFREGCAVLGFYRSVCPIRAQSLHGLVSVNVVPEPCLRFERLEGGR
jgi:hypothetical protein